MAEPPQQTGAQTEPSLPQELIMLWCSDTLRNVPLAAAAIDTRSPCNTITQQEMTRLLGVVHYLRARPEADDPDNPDPDPHQHHHRGQGLVGTKLLQIEHAEVSILREETFCIVTHAPWPIVLNRSINVADATPEVHVLGGSVDPKKDQKRKKEAKDQAKKREQQRIKEREVEGGEEDVKDEGERKVQKQAGQGQGQGQGQTQTPAQTQTQTQNPSPSN
ncbi:hypothetical protein A1O7_08641 [Cladophialophora yegresii CBS 114405]|uniref:Uncharacterized protein n=1 Tax=Cladophialophora yegresii CBS 114405 TaxID=1182544 RepID=W9VJ50_9EURO|nr:uncharacterized protein A1O7_08641 [Cladophialophora yegresii CBS 114405]EXJ55712.1 hypothetical protein A1O7_08641 [Cladophialophora yegresii CBS 114405]